MLDKRAAWHWFLVLQLLLVACSSALELNFTAMESEMSSFEDEHCMSTMQMEDALKLGAWKTVIDGKEHSAIILTSCDFHCMSHLLEPWLALLKAAKGGPVSQHAVVVSNGMSAFVMCDSLRVKYRHHCVLDLFCNKHAKAEHGRLKFGTQAYKYALVQKLVWAGEVVKMGVAALWMDMDIVTLQNPLPFLYKWPDADFMVAAGYWDKNTVFEGDVRLWSKGQGWVQNGGLWLTKPTPLGRQFMDMWVAQYLWDGVATGGLDNQRLRLDQSVLDTIVNTQTPSVPLFKQDPNGSYVRTGSITWPEGVRLYRLSMHVFQNRCFGPCGMSGDNTGWPSKRGAPLIRAAELPGYTRGPDAGSFDQLQCGMPRSELDRMITMHLCCGSDNMEKRKQMAWYWNVTTY